MSKNILLIGPRVGTKNSFYGGGTGGYTRNMMLYLKEFQFKNISLIPFYCSVRKKNELKLVSFPLRLFTDIYRFTKKTKEEQVDCVHILAQYRWAIYREFLWVFITRLLKKPVVYEVKAGAFINVCEKSKIHKTISKYILNRSNLILVEGKIYQEYILKLCSKKSVYFPNVVAPSEIPKKRIPSIQEPLKILYVGFCTEKKGVFDIVKAISSSELGMPIQLEMIGEESDSFSQWIEAISYDKNIKIIRNGRKPHSFVLERMKCNDIYIYPSRHPGEGHNNTINEAMMNSMIIIASKAGFLSDVLSKSAYFLDESKTVEENIRDLLQDIVNNPTKAIGFSSVGRRKIEEVFNSDVQGRILEEKYIEIL